MNLPFITIKKVQGRSSRPTETSEALIKLGSERKFPSCVLLPPIVQDGRSCGVRQVKQLRLQELQRLGSREILWEKLDGQVVNKRGSKGGEPQNSKVQQLKRHLRRERLRNMHKKSNRHVLESVFQGWIK